MKTVYKLGLLIWITLYSFLGYSQSIDEIIKKHIDAHGGIKNWEAIKSMKISGQFTSFSTSNKFTMYKDRSGYYWSEFHMGKYLITEAFNGNEGWTMDPWQDIDFPRGIGKTEINVILQKADLCTPLFNYKKAGYHAELEGKKTLEGQDVYVIKLTRPNQQTETWYLNAETCLEFKSESMWHDFTWAAPCETYYDDFRKVNGVMIPFYVERTFSSRNRMWEIEDIAFNVDFDPGKFEMPASDEMMKLGFMEGKWGVRVEAVNRRGGWYPVDSTVSNVEFREKNMLVEQISYEQSFPMKKCNTITYNSQTKKYRMTVYNSFGSDLEVYEGKFKEDHLVFDNVNIRFGDEPGLILEQFTFSNISKNGFQLEIKQSADKGEIWNASNRFTYTKLEK